MSSKSSKKRAASRGGGAPPKRGRQNRPTAAQHQQQQQQFTPNRQPVTESANSTPSTRQHTPEPLYEGEGPSNIARSDVDIASPSQSAFSTPETTHRLHLAMPFTSPRSSPSRTQEQLDQRQLSFWERQRGAPYPVLHRAASISTVNSEPNSEVEFVDGKGGKGGSVWKSYYEQKDDGYYHCRECVRYVGR